MKPTKKKWRVSRKKILKKCGSSFAAFAIFTLSQREVVEKDGRQYVVVTCAPHWLAKQRICHSAQVCSRF
jgi:hypothetical protein